MQNLFIGLHILLLLYDSWYREAKIGVTTMLMVEKRSIVLSNLSLESEMCNSLIVY